MKTAVMMIGEFEYDGIFFGRPEGDDSSSRFNDSMTFSNQDVVTAILPYSATTLIFFLAFMIIMPIIIMNLLVSMYFENQNRKARLSVDVLYKLPNRRTKIFLLAPVLGRGATFIFIPNSRLV